MNTKRKWAAVLLVLPIILLLPACGSSGSGEISGGTLQLSLTDAPGNYLSLLVKITGIYAIVGDSGSTRLDFANFSSSAVVEETADSVTVDLIQLSNQEPIVFALADLPVGDVNQIRLVVSEASLTAYEDVVQLDGNGDGQIQHVEATYPVKVPSGPQTGIKLNPRDIEINAGSLTTVTLDFDADKSIVQLGDDGSRDYDFILKPVIFILEAVGAIPVDTDTVAVGLNFPTDVKVGESVGAGSAIGEGDVLVGNAGTSGTNRQSVLDVDPSQPLPVDTTTLTPFVSYLDTAEGEPLVDSPSGVGQHLDLVWVANAASAAGTVSEIYTSGNFSDIYIDNNAPTESLAGLVETSGVEFGGFAPNGPLLGRDYVVYQTNGNGSLTGLFINDSLVVDILGSGSFTDPTDLAFVPSATPIQPDDPAGTLLGWLFVTDAATNQVGVVTLRTSGGAVGDTGTRVTGLIENTFAPAFVSEPVGIAYSPDSDRLYIANRGNGSITAIRPDGTEVATYDTGFGANALNGIDAASNGTEDILYLTNTSGNDDPANDNPSDSGASTLERVVIPLD